MIQSFRHKGLEDFHYDGTKKGIGPSHAQKLADILDVLDAATNIQDINFPGSRLHRLQPRAENRWSVRVSSNWRVTFRFEQGDVWEIDYEDYH
jgi:proteic killer suppression protein